LVHETARPSTEDVTAITATYARLCRRSVARGSLSRRLPELALHVGGEPTRAQAVLIDRIAWLRLHIVLRQ
jgi:hypothetical protein